MGGAPDRALTEPAPDEPVVVVDDRPLRVDDVVRVADGARLELGPAARRLIDASRAVVDALVDGEALIYGLNTGLGHERNLRLPAESLAASQEHIVRLHDGGIGEPLPSRIVRAAMTVRVAGIARGGSGASPGVADTYVGMLNAGIHPLVPSVGSVGASDLMHMAAIARAAMGEGEVEVGGVTRLAAEALGAAGLPTLQLAPKDGLSVISANGVSIGHAALVIDRASRLADVADLVVAVSMEAIRGNPSIVEPAAAAAKPVPGQAIAADRIRRYLEGSQLCVRAESVQDPLSFRVSPQVHGAFRAVLDFARQAVDGELAASDDNPLVVIGEGRMVSNGNFHPMLMALAIDALRPALAHVGQLSDRRIGRLWDKVVADPASLDIESAPRLRRYGSPLVRYAAAARTAELRSLAGPATLDVGPLDLGVEDHATAAPLAVVRTDAAIGLVEDVLAVELLVAALAIDWEPETRGRMAGPTRRVVERLASTVESLGGDAPTSRVHAAVRERLLDSADPLDGGA